MIKGHFHWAERESMTDKYIMLSLQIQVHKAKHAGKLPHMQTKATNESIMDRHGWMKEKNTALKMILTAFRNGSRHNYQVNIFKVRCGASIWRY